MSVNFGFHIVNVMIQDTTDKIQIVQERMKVAQDRQKSYVVKRRRPIELQVDRAKALCDLGRKES